MSAYYNENDPKAAAWLRELIKENLIAPGEVDERSIVDVKPDDLTGFAQCHFFAGIGGWSYALHLAGWPDNRSVWTASLPCQPFSAAGQRKGKSDARNLWEPFFDLVRTRKPVTIFGEQVKAAIGFGWLDRVFTDLEAEGYSTGAAVLGAHSVGAPHIRQRLYWLADASSERRQQIAGSAPCDEAKNGRAGRHGSESNGDNVVASDGENSRLANTDGGESRHRQLQPSGRQLQQPQDETACWLGDSDEPGSQGRIGGELPECSGEQTSGAGSASRGMGDANGSRSQSGEQTTQAARHGNSIEPASCWSNYELIPCADGKSRRIESGTFPLAHGISGRVGLLRGYGNAIVPQVAQAFIEAFLKVKDES